MRNVYKKIEPYALVSAVVVGQHQYANKGYYDAVRDAKKAGYTKEQIQKAEGSRQRRYRYIMNGIASTTSASMAASDRIFSIMGKTSHQRKRSLARRIGGSITRKAILLAPIAYETWLNKSWSDASGKRIRSRLNVPKKTEKPKMSRAQAAKKAALARWSQWRSGNKPRK